MQGNDMFTSILYCHCLHFFLPCGLLHVNMCTVERNNGSVYMQTWSCTLDWTSAYTARLGKFLFCACMFPWLELLRQMQRKLIKAGEVSLSVEYTPWTREQKDETNVFILSGSMHFTLWICDKGTTKILLLSFYYASFTHHRANTATAIFSENFTHLWCHIDHQAGTNFYLRLWVSTFPRVPFPTRLWIILQRERH